MTKLTDSEKKELKIEATAEYEKIVELAYVRYKKRLDEIAKSARDEYMKIEEFAYVEYMKRCKEIDKM